MTWYYWLYVAIAIEWFLVNYGALVQPPARQNVWLFLLAYPDHCGGRGVRVATGVA